MSSNPLISVCIDVHNYADYLPQAVESVLGQTCTDFEIIIVDDCSTDGSCEIAERYARQDARIAAHRNPVNLGMIGNRNACLQKARGRYVKFLHADDYLFSPEALARMAALMQAQPALSLIAAGQQSVDASGHLGETVSHFPDSRPRSGVSVIQRCLVENKNLIGGPSAVMIRADRARRGFDESYFHAADLEMWFHLLEQGAFSYIPEPLAAYRWHPRQQTEKDRATLSQADDQYALVAAYLRKPYIRLDRGTINAVRFEAVYQRVRRLRQLGRKAEALAAIHTYVRPLYYRQLLRRALRKKFHRPRVAGVPAPAEPLPLGINLAGFIKGEYGIGHSSRAFCRAARDSGLPTVMVNVECGDHRNLDTTFTEFTRENPYRVNLMTFSFDYSRRFAEDMGPRFFAGRYNIALWYWELEQFPARWHANFDFYDEIWVVTEFCRKALAAVSPIPVHKITVPLYLDPAPAMTRADFGLEEKDCVFLFIFDFHSTVARKNPGGLIEAFRRAFSPTDDAILVMKSINSSYHPAQAAELKKAASSLRVRWIEEHLPGGQIDALVETVDCYVSLHRSEGLGLGMAQAMARGKPVIATGWSGNLEFMNDDNSLLVPYKLFPVLESAGSYDPGHEWASADLDAAAERMRWVFTHRGEAASLGERARTSILRTLNPALTARQIAERVRIV